MENYFTPEELSCRCGCGWNNFNESLLLILNSIRKKINRPIFLNSACRCPGNNAAIGSRETSSHPKGLAADIKISNSSERDEILRELYQFAAPAILRIGIAKRFIHIDVDMDKPQNKTWLY